MEKKEKFFDKLEKWVRKNATNWKFWFWVSVGFLAVVQILFTIPAPIKLLDAAWEAGDFISFVGTIILGYIAMRQTQRANKTAEDANKVAQAANETSQKLIQLQEEEYLPVVTVSNFVGMTKQSFSGGTSLFQTQMVEIQMRNDKNEVAVGYSLTVLADNTDVLKETYCRSYEIHFVYSGHFVLSNFRIKSIKFSGTDFEKEYTIPKSYEMSLCDKEKLILFVFLISNDDFMEEGSTAYKYLKAKKCEVEIEMVTMQGKVYAENINIEKTLIQEPEPTLKQPNIEMMLSAVYKVKDKEEKE